tara:strand:+ start:5087 stop:8179 length:3093 start_codon:yes stop_codon:yes gene_type:complete
MPTHRERYNGQLISDNDRTYLFRIYDKNYSGQTIPLKVGGGGIKIKYDTSGQEKFSPIIASKCTISLVVEDNVFGNHLQHFITGLRTTYEEGDVTIVIWKNTNTARAPLWSGNVLIDLSAKEDVSKPYEVDLTATDGLGLLKNYDMVKTQGSGPYASADTYISDGYQTFIYWIKEILEFCNTPDSDSTGGDVADYTFSTSVDWWYENHPSPGDPDISPLAYTQMQMRGSYTITEDGVYKVKTVYEVLESICKMWGMRVVFWENVFYFTQIELYNTADVGTYATPDNVVSQIWRRNGAFSYSKEYLGDTYGALYTQQLEANIGGFAGGLQRLSGSKWDYYPKLKEVEVDFASISNVNYFQTFPQPTTSSSYNTDDNITSTPIATITAASTFSGFNIVIALEYDNNYAPGFPVQYNWGVRAKPSADPDFANGYYLTSLTTASAGFEWKAYPGTASDAFRAEINTLTSGNALSFQSAIREYLISGHVVLPIGVSQQTIFSGIVPTDSNFTGDWDFEFFTFGAWYNPTSPLVLFRYQGHHSTCTQQGGGLALNAAYLGASDVTYTNIYNNGLPISQFNPVLNSIIGGTQLTTNVYSARSDTQKQDVDKIWWGDTPTHGEPSSLIWTDDSGNSGYTDPNGLWRNGQSGSFDKLLAEVLGEARMFNQQQSDYKWSLTTAVSEINDWKNDGTGSRPVYVNPIGRLYDSVDRIYYYMLRGTFEILKDQWQGEWIQTSYGTTSITTTSTGGGGTRPNDDVAAARLGPANTDMSISQSMVLTRLSAALASGTITSISINQLVPEGSASPSNVMKSGDKFYLSSAAGGTMVEFEASADVSDTDTTISVVSQSIDYGFKLNAPIIIGTNDLYKQYQHQDRGTVGGMTVATSQMGPITIDGEGNYTIDAEVINGVDLDYIKLIPRDFISNDDQANKEWAFDDTGTTGVRMFNANTELWAFVPIPYGKKATHVAVWGNNTKDVEAYELDINASGIGTALGSGTVGTEFSITNLSSDATNYLGVKVITTGTSNRIYGGKVTLANI